MKQIRRHDGHIVCARQFFDLLMSLLAGRRVSDFALRNGLATAAILHGV